jgi:hypothetical protein
LPSAHAPPQLGAAASKHVSSPPVNGLHEQPPPEGEQIRPDSQVPPHEGDEACSQGPCTGNRAHAHLLPDELQVEPEGQMPLHSGPEAPAHNTASGGRQKHRSTFLPPAEMRNEEHAAPAMSEPSQSPPHAGAAPSSHGVRQRQKPGSVGGSAHVRPAGQAPPQIGASLSSHAGAHPGQHRTPACPTATSSVSSASLAVTVPESSTSQKQRSHAAAPRAVRNVYSASLASGLPAALTG